MARPEILVIGAGIVGLSAASALAEDAHITVLEMERQPAYHSSGRSAATYIEPYDIMTVAQLTMASHAFFTNPPEGFSEVPLIHPRGGLTLCPAGQEAVLDAFLRDWAGPCPRIHEISVDAASAMIPALRRDYLVRAALDPTVVDLDVHALISGHRRRVLGHGGQVLTQQRVVAFERAGGRWQVRTEAGNRFEADIVIDAAGAWGEQVATLAGVRGVGLVPKRRTAVLVDAPAGMPSAHWPMVHDATSSFYFRPESGRLMLSPADKTPSEPCDAQPEEIDVAIAIDRAQAAADLPVRSIAHRWAGLRSFVADDRPVNGYAPDAPGFYWLVGQGGFGVQTSPTMARIARHLVLGLPMPDDLLARGLTAAALSPARLQGAAA
jgi:D-arginine dehydrogenase